MWRRRKKNNKPVEFLDAPDIKEKAIFLMKKLDMPHINSKQLFFIRSKNSVTRAYARIWGLSRIFQIAAGYKPTYVIEVLSEHYDSLSEREQLKVLVHEMMHIPKTFSGALLSHSGRYHKINDKEVEKVFQEYIERKK